MIIRVSEDAIEKNTSCLSVYTEQVFSLGDTDGGEPFRGIITAVDVLVNYWCFISFSRTWTWNTEYCPPNSTGMGWVVSGVKKKKRIINLDLGFLSFLFSHSTELRKKKRKYVDTRSAHPVVFFGGTCRTWRTASKGRTIHSRAGRKLLN